MKGTVRAAKRDEQGRALPGSTWFFQCTLTTDSNRRQVTRRGYPTKRAAQSALTEFLSAHGRGDRRALRQPSAQALGKYLTGWIDTRAADLKPSTVQIYRDTAKCWIEPHLGDVALRDLDGQMIARWHAKLRVEGGKGGRPLGARSAHAAYALLRSALIDATESGLIAVDPISEIARKQRPRQKTSPQLCKVWTADEAKVFLTATADDRLHPLWVTLLSTGMRRGEALALTWDDVDLDAATLTIARSRTQVGGGVVEGSTKSGKSRTVDLDPATVAALRRWRKHQTEERLAAGPVWEDSGHVFCDELGEALSPGAISRRFERIVARLDIPRLSIHGTRHTSGTLSLLAGVPVHIVAARLGHDAAILLKIYAHLTPASGRDAATRIGDVLFGTATS